MPPSTGIGPATLEAPGSPRLLMTPLLCLAGLLLLLPLLLLGSRLSGILVERMLLLLLPPLLCSRPFGH